MSGNVNLCEYNDKNEDTKSKQELLLLRNNKNYEI